MLFSTPRRHMAPASAPIPLPSLALSSSVSASSISDAARLVLAWREWTPTAPLRSNVRGILAWASAVVSVIGLLALVSSAWFAAPSIGWLYSVAPVVLFVGIVVFLFTLPGPVVGKVYGWAVVANEVSFWVFVAGAGVLAVAADVTVFRGIDSGWAGGLGDLAAVLSGAAIALTALSAMVPPPLFSAGWRPRIWTAFVASAIPVWTALCAVVGVARLLPSKADSTGSLIWTGAAVALAVGLLTFVFARWPARAKRISAYRAAFTRYLAAVDHVRVERTATTVLALRDALTELEDVLTEGRLRPQRTEWSAGPGNVLLFLVRSRLIRRTDRSESGIEVHLWSQTSTWSDDRFLDAIAAICVAGRCAIVGQRMSASAAGTP